MKRYGNPEQGMGNHLGGSGRLPREGASEPSPEGLRSWTEGKDREGDGFRGHAGQMKQHKGDPTPVCPPQGEDLLPLQRPAEPPDQPAG